jgi:asparagine synthase (glutamine-hydrolysing)
MSVAITHRGPDDHGAWSDGGEGIGFGFRRLSVVELSQAGHQPMLSSGGRFVIVFNGEVYNHMELREDLSPLGGWRGTSDTETLLAGFESWGVTETLEKTVGMFAIALWDKTEKKLHLIRDRFGEKPLYYGWTGQGDNTSFLFGSELKSMVAFTGFNNPVSRHALTQYMRFTYVPAPYSIYKDVYKLEPGCMLTVDGFVPN